MNFSCSFMVRLLLCAFSSNGDQCWLFIGPALFHCGVNLGHQSLALFEQSHLLSQQVVEAFEFVVEVALQPPRKEAVLKNIVRNLLLSCIHCCPPRKTT